MVRVVAHQSREIESDGESCLPVSEEELVALIRIPGAAEAGELSHSPQPAAIPRGVNAARVRIYAGHPQRFRTGLGRVERSVDRTHLLFGVAEANVSQLARVVSLPPFGDFLPQQSELGALLLDRLDELGFRRFLGAGAFQFGHLSSSPRTSSPRCRNSWSATPNGVALPSSTAGSWSSSQLIVPVFFHNRPRTLSSTTSITRSLILSRRRVRSVPLCSR